MDATTARQHRARTRIAARIAAAACAVTLAAGAVAVGAAPAQAAACSSTSQANCTVNTSTTVTAGQLGLTAPANLYWNFVQSGYDQVQSGSSTALTGCTASGGATMCLGATAPQLQVIDARGGTAGWALSAYVTGANLPSGSVLAFNGAGTTIGSSVIGSAVAATTPTTVCDFNSTCTTPTPATTCSQASLGFTTCPVYGTNLLNYTTATSQVDLYSAATSTGLGAICFASGTATATGCTGATSKSFFNMTMPSRAAANTYTGAVINLTATSGP